MKASTHLALVLMAGLAACHGYIHSGGDDDGGGDAGPSGDGGVPAGVAYWAITANANHMLVAAGASAPTLAAIAAASAPASSWHVLERADGTVALQAQLDGQYVVVDASGRLARSAPGAAEAASFTLEQQGDGSFALRAKANGHYVSVDAADGATLHANAAQVGTNETFRFGLTGSGAHDTPDFGANVLLADPANAGELQARVNGIFAQEESNEFGNERHAILLRPGSYDLDVNVGYYTQVVGLGSLPDDVAVHGDVHVEADFNGGNATQTFWRSAEGVAIYPAQEPSRWAVSQACPYRRMHVHGSLALDDNGWSSGGFISDSLVDGNVNSGTQQQFLTRSSEWGSWSGRNWNMVFAGVVNAPDASAWPDPPYTSVDTVPVVREKPFLYIDASGGWDVFVPALRHDTRGTTWHTRLPEGRSIPIDDFYIAKEAVDTADSLNAALDAGKHILFTPGVYHLNDALRVSHADTVILGLGLATLLPDNGVVAMRVGDIDGAIIAGLLFDAGETSSPVLLEVGPAGSSVRHVDDPTSLHDLFFRVGGAHLGRAKVSLAIHSHDVIGDHFWIWRGDHSYGVGWDQNLAENGLVVDGDHVSVYGLFVEHYQRYQTIWNGDDGRVIFYQSEIPYDVPGQNDWMNGNVNGYSSYKVGRDVATHEAWGLGIYCYFSDNPSVKLASAIEAPDGAPGVKFHHAMTVSIQGAGEITHVVNGKGGTVNAGSGEGHLAQFP